MTFNFLFSSCTFCQAPHLLLASCLIASVTKGFRWHLHARVLFHLISGLILLFLPQLLHGPMIAGGSFDNLHLTLQRYTAPFHLGFAFFHYKNSFNSHNAISAINPVILFSKVLVAAFLLINKFLTAYLLYEQKARGQRVSQNFLSCSFLVDGIWLIVEFYFLINSSKRSISEEIEIMCARTRCWMDFGYPGFGPQRVFFWIDATIFFFYSFFQFAFSGLLLNIIIRREILIAGLHEMYAREFAVYCLGIAICSLAAPIQFALTQQKQYAEQRILTQFFIFILNIYTYFGLNIYTPIHIISLIISFFHCALLFMIWQRCCGEEALETKENREIINNITNNNTSKVTAATVTLRSAKNFK
uniref:Uncharacterized protein n=1 Tax=Meloidogyne enterolobii TaxID=390850 RepID=A0A6V7UNW9_MELEN|nr:unnamed protein product [Meloidogyne enterolobii]